MLRCVEVVGVNALVTRRCLSCGVAVLVAACSSGRPSPAGADIVIDHVTVLDGRGGAATPDARVVVRGSQIVEVSPATRVPPVAGTVIDGTGRFLVPGFIDMHAHLLFPRCDTSAAPPRFDRALSERALAQHLEFGITAVRSPATPTVAGMRLRDDLNAGRVRGPRAYASAELINDASLTDAALREAVREALPARPDFIKVYARLDSSQVAVIADEAHRHQLPVIGHLQRTSWMQGLGAGIDHLAHAVDWSVSSLPEAKRAGYSEAVRSRGGFRARIDWLEAFDPSAPAQQRMLAELARRRVSVDVTLIAYAGKFAPPADRRYRDSPSLQAFPELVDDWTRCADATEDWTPDDFRRWQAAWPTLQAWVRAMHSAGVLLVTGTDLTNEWIAPGAGLHDEFELLARAGVPPDAILRMTGANAAESLRRADIGIVERGRRADLVLLAADPRQNIRNARSIVWVMQGGQRVGAGVGGR